MNNIEKAIKICKITNKQLQKLIESKDNNISEVIDVAVQPDKGENVRDAIVRAKRETDNSVGGSVARNYVISGDEVNECNDGEKVISMNEIRKMRLENLNKRVVANKTKQDIIKEANNASETLQSMSDYYEVDNFYEYVVSVYINGNFTAAKSLFLNLNSVMKKEFMHYMLEGNYMKEFVFFLDTLLGF